MKRLYPPNLTYKTSLLEADVFWVADSADGWKLKPVSAAEVYGGASGVSVVNQTTAFTAEYGNVYECDGTFVVSLPSADSGASGFVALTNQSTGVVTVNCQSGETANGLSSFNLYQYESVTLYPNGTGKFLVYG